MIELYKQQDKASLMQLFHLNSPQHFHPGEALDFNIFLDTAEHYFVYRENGSAVGCGGFAIGHEDSKSACICWDIIHPEHHGRGIGRQLVEYRLTQLKQHKHISRVYVRTAQGAAAFYSKLGFQLCYTKKDFWAPGFDLHYMEQQLH